MPNTYAAISSIDLEEVTASNENARHLIAGFWTAMPTLAEIWRLSRIRADDVPALSAEVARLFAELERRTP